MAQFNVTTRRALSAEDKALLADFLKFLNHNTDAFDPVMISMARDNGHRFMDDGLVEDFINDFVQNTLHPFTGGQAWGACTVCGRVLMDDIHED